MKRLLLFLVLVSGSFLARSQVFEKQFRLDVKGPVKTVKETKREFKIIANKMILPDTVYEDEATTWFFDRNRNIYQIISPAPNSPGSINKTILNYTATNLLDTISYYHDEVLERYFTFKRDAKGLLLEQEEHTGSFYSFTSQAYFYAYAGNQLVEVRDTTSTGQSRVLVFYSYNPKGQLIKEEIKHPREITFEYHYNDKGERSATYKRRKETGSILLAAYKYNDKGDVLEVSGKREILQLRTQGLGSKTIITYQDYKDAYEYTYDAHGNWVSAKITHIPLASDVSHTEYDDNGTLVDPKAIRGSLLERVITYY